MVFLRSGPYVAQKEIEYMFVYQKTTNKEASHPVLMVMASLLFGGVARLAPAIPSSAFIFTVLAL